MKKILEFFQNRIVLKFLLVILSASLATALFFLQSYKKEVLLIPKRASNSAAIKRLTNKADLYFDNYQYKESYYYFNEAQALCDPQFDYVDLVYAVSCMAAIQQIEGNFTESEVLITKILPYLKKIEKPRFAANAYGQLAANYYYTYDYNNALYYHIKALHLKTSNYRKICVLNSIALVYIAQKKYAEAEKLLISLSKIRVVYKDDKNINDVERARILDNLGLCYLNQDNPKSLYYLNKSLDIKMHQKEDDLLMYNYKHLAYYFKKINPKTANDYALKAYKIGTRINASSNRIETLGLLIATSDGNDLRNYTLKYIALTDSVTEARKKSRNQFANLKYDFKKDKAENLQLKNQKIENKLLLERQKNRIIISYTIIFCILCILLFLCFHLFSKGKKAKKDAIYESELRISKKLDETLADDLYQTLAFAEKNNLELPENKEHLLNSLDIIYSRTRNISKENSPISTDEDYEIELREMISGFTNPNLNILVNGLDLISWNKIDKNKKITIYRVLQELFINMSKHSNATLVSLIFKIADNNAVVMYSDNGVGIQNNRLNLKNGLQNVESRIKTIKGTIIFDNNFQKGFKISFTFPL